MYLWPYLFPNRLSTCRYTRFGMNFRSFQVNVRPKMCTPIFDQHKYKFCWIDRLELFSSTVELHTVLSAMLLVYLLLVHLYSWAEIHYLKKKMFSNFKFVEIFFISNENLHRVIQTIIDWIASQCLRITIVSVTGSINVHISIQTFTELIFTMFNYFKIWWQKVFHIQLIDDFYGRVRG